MVRRYRLMYYVDSLSISKSYGYRRYRLMYYADSLSIGKSYGYRRYRLMYYANSLSISKSYGYRRYRLMYYADSLSISKSYGYRRYRSFYFTNIVPNKQSLFINSVNNSKIIVCNCRSHNYQVVINNSLLYIPDYKMTVTLFYIYKHIKMSSLIICT